MSDTRTSPAVADDFTQEWHAWREERDRIVAAPGGILPVTSITFLTSDPARIERIPGSWSSAPDGVVVDLAEDEGAIAGGTGRVVLPRAPQFIPHGELTIEILPLDGWDIVRVRDPHSPALTAYAGTPAYAPDPAWRLEGRWIPVVEQVDLGSVIERLSHTAESPGVVEVEVGGRTRRLTATPARGRSDAVVLLFRDATSGHTTYAAVRELLVSLPQEGDRVIVDFNRAYNKPCAYSDFAVCPLPPHGNILDVAVRAGERTPYERGGTDPDGSA